MAEITVFDLCSLYIECDEEVIIWNVQEKKKYLEEHFQKPCIVASLQTIL